MMRALPTCRLVVDCTRVLLFLLFFLAACFMWLFVWCWCDFSVRVLCPCACVISQKRIFWGEVFLGGLHRTQSTGEAASFAPTRFWANLGKRLAAQPSACLRPYSVVPHRPIILPGRNRGLSL
jgi:hypothetical protein